MTKIKYALKSIVFAFAVFLYLIENGYSTDSSISVGIGNQFLQAVSGIMSNFRPGPIGVPNVSALFSTISHNRANLLVAEEGKDLTIYVAGKSPIMSTAEKEEIQRMLGFSVLDVFDVILPPGQSAIVRNTLLSYAKAQALVFNLDKFHKTKQLNESAKATVETIIFLLNSLENLDRSIPELAQFVGKFPQIGTADADEINGLLSAYIKSQQEVAVLKGKFANISTEIKQMNQMDGKVSSEQLSKASSLFESYKKKDQERSDKLIAFNRERSRIIEPVIQFVEVVMAETTKQAGGAVRLYFDCMRTYFQTMGRVSIDASKSALFGLTVLEGSALGIQVAYIVAPSKSTADALETLAQSKDCPISLRSQFAIKWKQNTGLDDAFWRIHPMYGVVKMFHSEPMHIFRCLSNPKLSKNFFFTQRDMCETCNLIVESYAQLTNQVVVVLSEVPCAGETGAQSIVDFLCDGTEFRLLEKTPKHTVVPKVCRIRGHNLSRISGKGIVVDFGQGAFCPSILEEESKLSFPMLQLSESELSKLNFLQ